MSSENVDAPAVELVVDPEFQALIPPLSTPERAHLEQSLLAEGCRDPLVVWRGVLLDGHHRLEICRRHGLPYRTVEVDLASRDEALAWALRNQIGRRNLSPYARVELALRIEPALRAEAKARQATAARDLHGTAPPPGSASTSRPLDTRQQIAELAGVSHDSVDRVRTILERASDDVKARLRAGTLSINGAITKLPCPRAAKRAIRRCAPDASARGRDGRFVLTADPAVVPCDAIITAPLLTTLTGPTQIEAATLEWTKRWSASSAAWIGVAWAAEALFEGRRLLDSGLSGYAFQQLVIWHDPDPRVLANAHSFQRTWQPVFLYRRNGDVRPLFPANRSTRASMDRLDCQVAVERRPDDNNGESGIHITMLPKSVLRCLVQALTKPGDCIADPFSRTGVTGVAALELGRRFHGIEANDELRARADASLRATKSRA